MKNRNTYKILTLISVIFPLDRLYIGRHCFIRCFSLNLLGIGWLQDLFYRDKTFDEAMARRGFNNTTIRNADGR
ncbi:hypothetical protein vBOeSunk162_42 [Oenococcus phage vB_OeS_unk162]|nr:hypothetical protein vBOeSunk162_42 [Oenococcus phage vB_OeS_unk162]